MPACFSTVQGFLKRFKMQRDEEMKKGVKKLIEQQMNERGDT